MKKKHGRHSKKTASHRGPFFASHPLNGVSYELRKQFAVEYGKHQQEKFATLLPKTLELVSQIDPLHTITLMSVYGLMASPERLGDHKNDSTTRVQQGHIEYLQALCLQERWTVSRKYPEPAIIQQLFDTLPELFEAFQTKRVGTEVATKECDLESRPRIVQVQEFVRTHTAVVRNWGYFGTVTRITRQLLSRLDDPYELNAGVPLSKIVDIFEWLMRRHERIVNEHLERVHAAFSKKNREEMLEQFFATFALKGAVDEVRIQLSQPNIKHEQAMAALLPLSDRFIAPALVFTNQEIAEALDIDYHAVSILTNSISLAFSDLCDEDPGSFFLDNPVWLRPLIYLDKDTYICPTPQTLMSFVLPIAEQLLVPFEGLKAKLSNARAAYLEEEVARLVEHAFPGCMKHRSFKWREGSDLYESDLVVRFDTTLLLIEAKSGQVSWPALRGAPSRLVEHIKKLIVEPSDQSGRLAQRIQEDIARLKSQEPPTLNFPLPLEGVSCVARLSVTLHDLATIQSMPAMLEDAGVLANKYPLAPCISLGDLEIMLDLLDSPSLRLHYLRRRAELLFSLRTIGDELDLLGMYLDTSFNLGTIQEGNTIIAVGYSEKVDRYYSLRDESILTKKPQPNTSPWFKRLCTQLESRGRPGWSEFACALLSIAPNDQDRSERHIRKIAKRVCAGKPLKNDHDALVLVPPEWASQALAFQVKRKSDGGLYSAQSQNIASQAFESKHVKRCAVVVLDAESPELGYLSVGLFVNGEEDQTIYY